MYHLASNVLYAQSQPHTHSQSDPVLQTSSQLMASHQPHSQRAELHADQTGDSMHLINTTHVHSAEQPTPVPSSDQWQTASRKRYRNAEDREPPGAKKTDYWLGETIPTSNGFSALMEETVQDSPNQSSDPKPPPISSQVS
jgi:hypothetical protein